MAALKVLFIGGSGFTPEHVRLDVDLFAGRTGQFVFISSASAYQKPVGRLPIVESTPLRNRVWPYSQDKIACEEQDRVRGAAGARVPRGRLRRRSCGPRTPTTG